MAFSSLGAQHLTELAIDMSSVLSGLLDEFDPFFSMRRHLDLAEQVGGLHDGFDRIAQIVHKFAHLFRDVDGEFLRVRHGQGPSEMVSSPDCTRPRV